MIKKKTKKKSINTQQKKSKLKRKLDALLQIKYTKLYPQCLVCGEPSHCMHHYIRKSQSAHLRYDENNLIPICGRCHCLHHQAGDPKIHQEVLRKKGHDWADALEEVRREPFKDSLERLREIEKQLNRL